MDIRDCYERGQPVLVGTTSIENSELLSGLLDQHKLPHNVLNAKQHAREAEIVAQAGRPKQITIATNMAGRGTDIVLGGSIERQIEAVDAREDLAAEQKAAMAETLRARMGRAAQGGDRCRRAAHRRHRAARVAPDRQPAARPVGTPGRPGFVAVLPVDGRPAAEDLRRRPAQGDHGSAQAARGRGDRVGAGQPLDRVGAAQGRGAQLRHPQAAARVRRRRQRAAQGHLRPAQRAAGFAGRLRADHQPAPRRLRRGLPAPRARREHRGAVGHRRAGERRCSRSGSCRCRSRRCSRTSPS